MNYQKLIDKFLLTNLITALTFFQGLLNSKIYGTGYASLTRRLKVEYPRLDKKIELDNTYEKVKPAMDCIVGRSAMAEQLALTV